MSPSVLIAASLPQIHAAVCVNDLACNVARFFRGQEYDGVCDLLRLADMPHRQFFQVAFPSVCNSLSCHFGFSNARRYAVCLLYTSRCV